MSASVKIEFDDGSRVISQTLEDTAGVGGAGRSPISSGDKRPASCSIDSFYEIPKTTAFIADGNFQRVALQFPDALLREAPEVLWTLQARLRKLAAGRENPKESEDGGTAPLIFVTGDTSYGSCCVDEVSAQHLKAEAIVHYGRACLSPTNSSVPVLYVFGRGDIDVQDLASNLLAGPLSPSPKPSSSSSPSEASAENSPVLLLYDVTYAYAIPALLEILGDDFTRSGGDRLVVGRPTPEAYSPSGGKATTSMKSGGGGCGCETTSTSRQQQISEGREQRTASGGQQTGRCSGREACCEGGTEGESCCSRGSGEGKDLQSCCKAGRADGDCCGRGDQGGQKKTPTATTAATSPSPQPAEALSPLLEAESITAVDRDEGEANAPKAQELLPSIAEHALGVSRAARGAVTTGLSTTIGPPPAAGEKRRIRIGGLGSDIESEDALKQHILVFVGAEGRQLSNVLLRCTGCVDRIRYDPSLPLGQRVVADTGRGNKDLMRRYYLVQRAKEAGVVGIVVGTLGVQRYSSVVRSLRTMIEDAGRKAYTLAVGKVNVAKLANFAEVDVFCLVACSENSLLDSKEFHAPVVTPLELEIALGKRDWDGFYSTDFDDILGLGSVPRLTQNDAGTETVTTGLPLPPRNDTSTATDEPTMETLTLSEEGGAQRPFDTGDDDTNDDKPFFSLVTGTYKTNPGVSRRAERLGDSKVQGVCVEGGALVGIGDRSLVEWSSPAADFLGQREYQGLEALVGQTEAKAATEGQSGIASDYGGV